MAFDYFRYNVLKFRRAFCFLAVVVFVFNLFGQAVLAQEEEDAGTVPGNTVDGANRIIVVKVVSVSRFGQDLDLTLRPAMIDLGSEFNEDRNLVEILESVPGVSVIEKGGEEGEWTIRVRGGSETALYFDGILLNSPLGGSPDISLIPLPLIQDISVYSGLVPAGYPITGTAGVVDFRTRSASSKKSFGGRSGADSFQNYNSSAYLTGKAAGGAGLLAASGKWGRGEYGYIDDRGTYDDDDDRERERTNNEFQNGNMILKWDRKASGYRLYSALYYQHDEKQLAGTVSRQTEDAREGADRFIIYAGLKSPGVFDPDLDAELRLHFKRDSFWKEDELGETGPIMDDRNSLTRIGSDLFFDYYGLRRNHFSFSFSVYEDEYKPKSNVDAKVEDLSYSRSSIYFTGADEISLMEKRLILKPRVRMGYEGNRYSGDSLIAQAGEDSPTTSCPTGTLDFTANYEIKEGLVLTGNIGRYYQTPSFIEEFGDRYTIVGNTDLDPEQVVNLDIGLHYGPVRFADFDTLKAGVRIYDKLFIDRIGWTDAGGGLFEADNLGGARVTGAELSLALDMSDMFAMNVFYAFQNSVNYEENDYALAGAPQNSAGLSTIFYRPYGKIYYEGWYQDARFLDDRELIKEDARLVHNLGIRYYKNNYSIGFKAANIGNNRSLESLGYPVTGARYLVSFEIKD